MKKLYTVQIIPEGSTQIHYYRISRIWLKLFTWLVCIIAVLMCVFIWKFTEINMQLANFWKLKADNELLVKRHAEYEYAFSYIDSIYAIEQQIQNILNTYLEDDSDKIRSILDKNRLIHVALKRNRQFTDIEAEMNLNKHNLEGFPNTLPVIGIISHNYSEDHKAVDFAAPLGEPVYATATGKIVFAGDKGDLGLVVEIDHGDGISTRYAHLSRISVRSGSNVRKGEAIASVGNTGNSTSTHLHYEIIFNGNLVNPEKYF
ncbi:MAG: peptidoglycan DD-metalloendopeptidase family protein [Fibromonadaceae bacterium]|jgi:murein DD-endopeptidase MepM/ murein hydrolase activator NlpD|nr:peptidoglycan DD-metalloendopeptidase family protein [Fibromonadaceae bacterium]